MSSTPAPLTVPPPVQEPEPAVSEPVTTAPATTTATTDPPPRDSANTAPPPPYKSGFSDPLEETKSNINGGGTSVNGKTTDKANTEVDGKTQLSPKSSASSLNPSLTSRLTSALALREQAHALDKELALIEEERKAAVKSGNSALALAKKVEKETKEKEAKALHGKAEKKTFTGMFGSHYVLNCVFIIIIIGITANNPKAKGGSTYTPVKQLKLDGLEGEEAVRRTEEALEQLVRASADSSVKVSDADLKLKVTLGKGAKALTLKQKVKTAMLA